MCSALTPYLLRSLCCTNMQCMHTHATVDFDSLSRLYSNEKVKSRLLQFSMFSCLSLRLRSAAPDLPTVDYRRTAVRYCTYASFAPHVPLVSN